jgi:hypothetical protein
MLASAIQQIDAFEAMMIARIGVIFEGIDAKVIMKSAAVLLLCTLGYLYPKIWTTGRQKSKKPQSKAPKSNAFMLPAGEERQREEGQLACFFPCGEEAQQLFPEIGFVQHTSSPILGPSTSASSVPAFDVGAAAPSCGSASASMQPTRNASPHDSAAAEPFAAIPSMKL